MVENSAIGFEQLADLIPVCLLLLDADRQLVWGNRAWRDYTGGDCSGQPSTFAIHPEQQVQVETAFCQVYEQPRRLQQELRYRRYDGEYRAFQLLGAPCLQDGKVVGLICVLTDITDQQMVEEQMLALNDSLEGMVAARTNELLLANAYLKQTQSQMLQHEKMATIGQLAAGGAHEINNPIAFITSNLSSLSRYLERFNRYIKYQGQALAVGWMLRVRANSARSASS